MKIKNPKSKTPLCPYCRKSMSIEMKKMENNPFFPFCSQRCNLADLDKWFSAEYSIEQPLGELTDEQLGDLPDQEE